VSRTFNELARLAIAWRGRGTIDYIPMPESLLGKYQAFTEADLTALRTAGYAAPFLSLEEGLVRTFPLERGADDPRLASDPRQAVA
jgi:ADP-L-glycero-D-manno-heptose 6-epimerase